MSRLALLSVSILLLCIAGVLLSLNGCSGSSTTTITVTVPPPVSKIQHVVIIFQENRTPDNLFQGLCIPPYGNSSACSTNPTASQYDIASGGTDSTGATITLSPIDLGTAGSSPDNYDLSHAHSAFVEMCDLSASGVCQMNGADLIPYFCTTGTAGCPPPANPQFMYVIPADVQPYLTMAQTYTFADHMFQTNQGPSMPAHQFIISGTSAPSKGSNLFEAENPAGVKNANSNTGCTAPAAEFVDLIDPAGVETPTYPCFDHPTLTDLLNTADISWRYYAPSAGSIWTAPNAIEHMCGPSAPSGGVCTGADWTNNVVLASPQNSAPVLTDIARRQTCHGELGDSERTGIRPRREQRRVGSVLGDFDRQRDRQQPVLVEHGHHPCLGRLGRMVRPCAAAGSAGELRPVGLRVCLRIPGADDCDFALRQASLYLACQS